MSTDSTGTRLTISGEPSPFLQWGRAGEITVVLPPEVARGLTVTSQQRTGVLMTQADLGQVTARMTHGAVLLSGSARRIEVDSVDGDVLARTAIAVTESFRATTANGDIEVDFKTAPAHARRHHRQRRHPHRAAAQRALRRERRHQRQKR